MHSILARTLILLLAGRGFVLPVHDAFADDVKKPSSIQAKHHTDVSLLANVTSIQQGVPFTVGVLMKMEKGWHTYWKNSGEAGLPTKIDWKLPSGFIAGDIAWPLPHKYNENGEVITYGYQDENMLLVTIIPPATLKPGSSVTLAADINWLECERVCIPGSGSVRLTLLVAAGTADSANAPLFNRYNRQIPVRLTRQAPLTVATMTKDGLLELKVRVAEGVSLAVGPESNPDFYPEAIEALTYGRTKVVATTTEATLQVPISANEKVTGPFVLRGVLVYQIGSAERQAAVLDIALSREFCSSLPIAGEGVPQLKLLDQPFVTVHASGSEQPLYLYILFAVVGGLLLNIMPCVLPVIALKIFGLVKMAGDHPKQIKKMGWFFSLGILASFLVLALLVILLQTAGEQVGWGFQFQEPLFVIAMSAVVFAFGLSLFGVYEIQVPGAAVAGMGNLLAAQEKSGKGYAASFSEGVFATILATPCTAPFLGTALGFAFSQPAWVILLIFTSVSFGMALPYLVLTGKPAWLRFLPKPGEWMVTAKQFMGFLMMATLLWLLYVLGKQLGMEAVIWTGAFLLAVGIACWLIGRFATLTASRARSYTTWVVALVVVVLGYWGFVETILDVRSVIAGVPTAAHGSTASEPEGIAWQPFTLASLETHLRENKTVFVDFTADWCLTCKVNEKTVLTDRDVVKEFRTHNLVAIRADWTNRNPDITRLLAKFGRSGVPLYVIFPAGKPGEPIVLPEVITSGIVVEAINRATGSVATEQ